MHLWANSYDVFNEEYARLNAMIYIMNERYTHFVTTMREFGLLHETEPTLPFPRLEANFFFNDCESSLP